MEVYRANQPVVSLSNPTEISAAEIMPGFVLSLAVILTEYEFDSRLIADAGTECDINRY